MVKWKLTVIYTDGTRETGTYDTEDQAQEHMEGFKQAFGDQIDFIYISKVFI